MQQYVARNRLTGHREQQAHRKSKRTRKGKERLLPRSQETITGQFRSGATATGQQYVQETQQGQRLALERDREQSQTTPNGEHAHPIKPPNPQMISMPC